MSKERMEEIKELWEEDNHYCDPCNYEWLIERAERVQELEELIAAYHTELSIKDNANKRIKKKNKLYREALEFYANKKTYRYYKESYIDLLKDGGYIAREALEE